MNRRRTLAIAIAFSILTAVLTVDFAWAPATFSAQATPQSVNLGRETTITISAVSSQPNQLYNITVRVTKPDGVSVSSTSLQILTDFLGAGSTFVRYPTDPWADISGTPHNIDQVGSYTAVVDKLTPNPPEPGVATTSFTGVSTLYVTMQSPSSGTLFSRGETMTVTAYVTDYNLVPLTSATVSASSPTITVALPHSGGGIYTRTYEIPLDEATGAWVLRVNATSGGNRGSTAASLSVRTAELVISELKAHDSSGLDASEFHPGDRIFASLRVQYNPGTRLVTSGSIIIQVRNPSNTIVGNLTSTYDGNRGRFYSASGFEIASGVPTGTWQLLILANSQNDTYGNQGPTFNISLNLLVSPQPNTSIMNTYYVALAAIALFGGLGTTVFVKRFNRSSAPFETLFHLAGGEIAPPITLMITGDPGAGASTLGLQLAYRDLIAGKSVGLLSYDAFPSEIKKRMLDMGWDITNYLENGQLTILDCYSSLAGIEGDVQDPTDFTEVSIRVTGILEKSKALPSILLDSVTPIFNAAEAKDCINFLQVIGAKVKNGGGRFIFIASRGSIPEEGRLKTEALADGVIMLNLQKTGSSTTRLLSVRKMANRHISMSEMEFVVVPGKGIQFRKQRVPLPALRLK